MPRRLRLTFKAIREREAAGNARALEHKASLVASLAETYPEHKTAFAEIETAVLGQLFASILAQGESRDKRDRSRRINLKIASVRKASQFSAGAGSCTDAASGVLIGKDGRQ
jgi:hypothetical protein